MPEENPSHEATKNGQRLEGDTMTDVMQGGTGTTMESDREKQLLESIGRAIAERDEYKRQLDAERQKTRELESKFMEAMQDALRAIENEARLREALLVAQAEMIKLRHICYENDEERRGQKQSEQESDNDEGKNIGGVLRGSQRYLCLQCGMEHFGACHLGKPECHRCGKKGHLTNHCYSRKRLWSKWQDKPGKASEGSKEYGKGGEASGSRQNPTCRKCNKQYLGKCKKGGGICLRCGRMGHMAKDCYNKKMLRPPPVDVQEALRTRSCLNCGEFGHFVKKCHWPRTQKPNEESLVELGAAAPDGVRQTSDTQDFLPLVVAEGDTD